MTRLGSRSNPLVSALLAAADAGACTLPPGMVENRARLASMQAVAASTLRAAPDAEMRARAGAVRALVDDPAADVVGAVLAGRQADAEQQLRADLLAAAVETAADELDCLPDDWAVHLQHAFDDCVTRLTVAYSTFSPISTNPDGNYSAASGRVTGVAS